MRASRALAILAPLVAIAACRIEAIDGTAYAGPKNRCEAGCPVNASCVEGACVSSATDYPLVFEVTPPSSASFAPGVTFSIAISDQRAGTRDLRLPDVAQVTARLDVGAHVPLRLRLERAGAIPGTPDTVFETKSVGTKAVTPPLTVPPGDYHVWVAPADDRDLELIPPVQLRNDETREPLVVTLPSGAHEIQVAYASAFRTVDLELVRPDGEPLVAADEARDVRVIDETTGALASTIVRTCTEPGQPLNHKVSLRMGPELAGHRYTVRISPAEKSCSAATPVVRATLDLDLHALDVEGRGTPVVVTVPDAHNTLAAGYVTAFGTSRRVESEIVLRSVALDASVDAKTGRAWFTIRSRSNGDGSFNVPVLPGLYRADVIPAPPEVGESGPGYAACVDCSVPSQDPMSKPGERTSLFAIDGTSLLVFEVAPRVSLFASATGFDGVPFTLGSFELSGSTSTTAFAASGARLLTRASSGTIELLYDAERQWNLDAALDPGAYDLVVRTPLASGYPWIVAPRLQVQPSPEHDLGVVRASAPVPFVGRVVAPDGSTIPGATIRARALVGDPKAKPVGAILVGETRADGEGRYSLSVPATFTTLPTTSNAK